MIVGSFSMKLTRCFFEPDPEPDVNGEEEIPTAGETIADSTTTSDTTDNVLDEVGFGGSDSNDPSAIEDTTGFTMLSGSEEETNAARKLWVAHGTFMTISWAILVPCAIGASVLRNFMDEYLRFLPQNSWNGIHRSLNVLAVVATAIGFFLGVAATQKEKGNHFQKRHAATGLVVFLLVLLQMFLGFVRPAAASSSQDSSKEHRQQKQKTPSYPTSAVELEEVTDDNSYEPKMVTPDASEDDESSNGTSAGKPLVRRLWEYKHRGLGMLLLGLAWYNSQTGIQEEVERYGEGGRGVTTGIFWGLAGGISGLFFVLAYILRI